ncbi:MAG: hypothetical protein ACK4N5_05895 [Myxococcales bacterium]
MTTQPALPLSGPMSCRDCGRPGKWCHRRVDDPTAQYAPYRWLPVVLCAECLESEDEDE